MVFAIHLSQGLGSCNVSSWPHLKPKTSNLRQIAQCLVVGAVRFGFYLGLSLNGLLPIPVTEYFGPLPRGPRFYDIDMTLCSHDPRHMAQSTC